MPTHTDTEWPNIDNAKQLAKRYKVPGVIIMSFTDDRFAFASYGADRRRCKEMGTFGRTITEMIERGDIMPPVL